MQTPSEERDTDRADPALRTGPIPSVRLLSVSRGFSAIFWGLPLSLLMFFGALRVQIVELLRMPSYAVGVTFLLAGMLYMRRTAGLSARWDRWSRLGVFSCFMLLYLAPFVHWWKAAPYIRLFSINLVLLPPFAMVSLVAANHLASEIARALGRESLAAEAGLCAWLVGILMILPFVSAFGYAWYVLHTFGIPLQNTLSLEHPAIPIWFNVSFLPPFALTMSMVWRAKEACVGGLIEGSEPARHIRA